MGDAFSHLIVSWSATTAARKVILSSTLIGPFEFGRKRERPLNLSARSNSNGPIRVEDETTVRAAVIADLITSQASQESRRGEL